MVTSAPAVGCVLESSPKTHNQVSMFQKPPRTFSFILVVFRLALGRSRPLTRRRTCGLVHSNDGDTAPGEDSNRLEGEKHETDHLAHLARCGGL